MRNLIITTKIVIVLTLALGLTNAHAQVGDGILNDYPKEQGEFMETLNDIIQNVKNGNVDRLISFHAYTQNLLNFEGGVLRNGDEENEEHERNYKGKK